MKQHLLLFAFLLGLCGIASADTYRCSSCNQQVTRLYALPGLAGEKKMICANCYVRTPHCGICFMPVQKDTYHQLQDGRIVCGEDFNAGIFSQEVADEIVKETRRELERTFYRFNMHFPETNVNVSIVSADRIYELAQRRYDPRYPEINGFTRPTFFDQFGKEMTSTSVIEEHKKPSSIRYDMYLVSGLPRARMTAVCAHELGHVWHLSNLSLDRSFNLEGKTREAFCELLAYQLMGAMNQPYEQAVIEANLYTSGQASLLVETEKNYGFNRILEWMKNGQDLQLSDVDLDRIRLTDAPANSEPITAASPQAFVPFKTKIPDTLMLKGIMGSGAKKLALINNQTFSVSETAKVKIGTTNVSVQVLEIRDGSVLIRTNGEKQTVEILLQK
jgi:hypothetical protein